MVWKNHPIIHRRRIRMVLGEGVTTIPRTTKIKLATITIMAATTATATTTKVEIEEVQTVPCIHTEQ